MLSSSCVQAIVIRTVMISWFHVQAIFTSCLGRPFIKGGAFSQSLGGPKAPKPEPQISGKASFSGIVPSEYHGYVLLSACVGSSTLAARID